MRLVEDRRKPLSLAEQIEAEAERQGAAIRQANKFRIRPIQRRRDSRTNTRPRPAA